jgi:NADH-quinone oxidoreductase subunit N
MAGIPPLAGFFGKYYILSSALDRGLFTPVIAALGLSVVTTYYYIRIIRTL